MKKFILSLILALLMAGNVFAATISKSFTATGAGGDLSVKVGDSFTYDVSGTFVGTVVLQKSTNYFTWETVATATGSASGTVIAESNNANQIQYRFFCTAYTSGTIVTTMTDATGYNEPVQEFKNKNGKVIAYTTETGITVQDLTVTGTATGTGAVSIGGSSGQIQYNESGILGGVFNSGVDSSGNVGIGTSTALNSALTVNGGISLLGSGGGTLANSSGFQIDPANATFTTPKVTITSGGNLGLGTTTSDAVLKVVGTGTSSNKAFQILDSALTSRVLVSDQGFVGIGTTTLGSMLNVGTASQFLVTSSGAVTAASLVAPFITGTSSTTGALTLKSTSGSGTTDRIIFTVGNNGATESMRIVNSGNVGIGSTVPGAMLDVSDGIRSVKGAANGVGACWCTTPPKVLGYCTGALGTCSACNYNGSGC